jgi:hypothetical protein
MPYPLQSVVFIPLSHVVVDDRSRLPICNRYLLVPGTRAELDRKHVSTTKAMTGCTRTTGQAPDTYVRRSNLKSQTHLGLLSLWIAHEIKDQCKDRMMMTTEPLA